jgi:excisionase family DNA binding protein
MNNISASTEPLSVGVNDATRLSGLGKSKLWELIASGELAVKRVGRRTLIDFQSLKRLVLGA